MAADGCGTTIAIDCTEGYYGSGFLTVTCDDSNFGHITYRGSTGYELATAVENETAGLDVDAALTENCSPESSSVAVCAVQISGSVEDNGKTKTATTTTYEGALAASMWFEVPITAGAEKLPAAGATCTATGNVAAASAFVDLYKG